ncbi:MAG: hypothetical protein HQL13_03310 [Candidatus Omnitrophica bacterium]|nr:hypothetical protein [Candidatus Omnitrophota bacterium]
MEIIFATTVAPPIFVTDSEKQPEGRCFSEKLEKIGGKRQRVVEKMISKPYIELTHYELQLNFKVLSVSL